MATPRDKLPKEIIDKIKADATAAYADIPGFVAYTKGATAWAGWKVRYDELKTLLDKQLTTQQELLKAAEVSQALLQRMVDALEALLNVMPKGDSLRYFHAKEQVIAGRHLLQQFKDGTKGKEVADPCPHCGKELSRDRNLCCRACGKEVVDE